MAKPHETPANKSRKRKPPKMNSDLHKARASEPLEELESEPEVPDEVQDLPVPSLGDPAPNFAEGESSQAPNKAFARGCTPRCQCPHNKLFGNVDGLNGDIDSPTKA